MRLIDGEALNRQIAQECAESVIRKESSEYREGLMMAHTYANALPVFDPAPIKQGRWITSPESYGYAGAYSSDHIVCSECKHVWDILDNDTETFNYCPNCGVKMDERH